MTLLWIILELLTTDFKTQEIIKFINAPSRDKTLIVFSKTVLLSSAYFSRISSYLYYKGPQL